MTLSNEENKLLGIKREDYGDQFSNHLLEQYKLYVEMADRISNRRAIANNYLLSVNSFIITIYGIASSVKINSLQVSWMDIIPVGGILVCVTWFSLIRSYRNLNSAKFEVIHEFENLLPSQPYKMEWSVARGEDEKKLLYKPLTRIEQTIPIIFIVFYSVILLFSLCPLVK